ncbi:GNAT family N-acetyltransferase [Hyunsoonleella sp. SJ7]|uniref:GNAT family N-acetyltransferase n=1 Tax=Hyunsoonleella aquatilis TaxID=2762758 RepID=A0A923HF42_9FLAO|nr:GNAT family N-acetyltransferase [Hyunsoonleella aquatilis]MBC3760031.1 GNAT family N-acetyltransferase [Hyunsoonleella aquatilis]
MNFELKYISTTDKIYTQAKQVRIDCFFKGMDNADDLIKDKFEEIGIHIICLNGKQHVIGTGRIHITESVGIISQMAIKKENQRNGIGRKILQELIRKCKEIGVEKIELSARETALEFYSKNGFKALGNKYPSAKTGIIHQKMIMNINNVG